MTLWNFAVMIVAVCGVILSLNVKSFPSFFACFIVLFATAGLGNGSTYRMIPSIFRTLHLDRAAQTGEDRALALKNAGKETAAELGFVGAVGAYGGFFVPNAYSASIAGTGGVQTALAGFICFYITCMGITWWCYLKPELARRRAERHLVRAQAEARVESEVTRREAVA